jgi:hypothetical protein
MTIEKNPPPPPPQAQLILVNLTQSTLMVVEPNGSDLSNFAFFQKIGYGESLTIAVFTYKALDDQWDWIYLFDENNASSAYQLYFESTIAENIYQFFGYCDPSSTEKNSNPSPFPDGCADVIFQSGGLGAQYDFAYYVLRQTPPPKNLCAETEAFAKIR